MSYVNVIRLCDLKGAKRNEQGATACYVYVIHDPIGKCCKVGIATDPVRRLAALAIGNPRLELKYTQEQHGRELIDVPGVPMQFVEEAREVEKIAHALLEQWSVSGEWFSVPPEMAFSAIYYAEQVIDVFYNAMLGIEEKSWHIEDVDQ